MSNLINGVNDLKLKAQLLRSLIRDHLPTDNRAYREYSELHCILDTVKTHGLLSEIVSIPDPNRKVVEAWRLAMDEWVQCLISLIDCNTPDKCWVGVGLLGLTCGSCSSERFLASYSSWFHRLMPKLQTPSSTSFVKAVSCAALTDIFTRLTTYPNVKKDATSLAGKLVQPILSLLDEHGSEDVSKGAIDLLCIIISSFPFVIQRHYKDVERVIIAKLMLGKGNTDMSKKYAYCLAILPKVGGGENSWELLMQKILLCIHNLLTNAFQGIEEGTKSSEIMRLLVPPGQNLPPPLGGQSFLEESTKMLPGDIAPKVSILMHCCSIMLNNSYSVQVLVPIHHLLALIERVLIVDGSSRGPFTTAMHQEMLCEVLPILHASTLDLLHAVIKGVRSQLLPQAAHIARIMNEYFCRATLPSVRIKVYSVIQTLLISFGVGMGLYLSEKLTNNALSDLVDCTSNVSPSSYNSSKPTCDHSKPSGRKKRKHPSDSHIEKLNGTVVGMDASDRELPDLIRVKVAALKALESLLTVCGSLSSEWRSQVDSLLINVATNACDNGWVKERKNFNLGDESGIDTRAEFQLASLEALLASLLSPSRGRPPYLSQGFELFQRGKQNTGTKIASFCVHALLALEILIHPRSLPLIDDAPIIKNSEPNDEHDDIYDEDDASYYNCPDNVDEPVPTTIDNNMTTNMEIENHVSKDSKLERLVDEDMKSNDEDQHVVIHEEMIPFCQEEKVISNNDDSKKIVATNSFGDDSNLNKLKDISPNKEVEAPSNDLNIHKDVDNVPLSVGVANKNQMLGYDSDSTSIDSIGIVDVDPDSEDVD